LLEDGTPGVLGIGEDHSDKLRCFVARDVAIELTRRRELRLLLLGVDQRLWIAAEEEISDNQDDATDAAADRDPPASGAPFVLNVVAFASTLPKHCLVEWRG
jgi:hypothetical protein